MNSLKNLKLSILLLVAFVLIGQTAASDDPVKKDIVTIAVGADNFKTLVTAIKEAGLVDALKGDGPFTVFAPTDEAFSKLPEGTLESLLADKETLKKVLLYHVVSGKVTSSDVVNLEYAETLAEQKINIKVTNENVMINDSKVISADIEASNGIIHVIDMVLIPANLTETKK